MSRYDPMTQRVRNLYKPPKVLDLTFDQSLKLKAVYGARVVLDAHGPDRTTLRRVHVTFSRIVSPQEAHDCIEDFWPGIVHERKPASRNGRKWSVTLVY
jgi:hypothetical protein